jgi:site-specific DNA recombinase
VNLHVQNDGEDLGQASIQRACGYFRVSTGRQAEGDLSIPDQRKQVTAFCATRAMDLRAEYVEPGASATDDRTRPR